LMGKCPEMFHEGDSEVAAFRSLVVAASPEIDPDDVDEFLCIDTSQLDPEARQALFDEKLPSREDALEGLWATFDAELERLMPIRAKLWECEDQPALSEKIDGVAFDGSKKGVLRRRYESANHLDMHRCLKQFTEQRKQHEVRLEEEREIEKKARAERLAAISADAERRARARLRNEPKSSATKDKNISTSDKSAVKRPRDFDDPADYVKWVMGTKDAVPESPPPTSPAAPGAGEAEKPA
jgi:hypothetical protein